MLLAASTPSGETDIALSLGNPFEAGGLTLYPGFGMTGGFLQMEADNPDGYVTLAAIMLNVTVIPEPTSAALLLIGLVCICRRPRGGVGRTTVEMLKLVSLPVGHRSQSSERLARHPNEVSLHRAQYPKDLISMGVLLMLSTADGCSRRCRLAQPGTGSRWRVKLSVNHPFRYGPVARASDLLC